MSALLCTAVAVGVVWYCSGLGYMMSVMLEPQNSMVASVAIVLVLGGFFNGVEPRLRTQTPFMKNVFGEPDLPSYYTAQHSVPNLLLPTQNLAFRPS